MTAKAENLPLLKWIQEQGSSGTDQYFEYIIPVGDKNELAIQIKGGEFGNSEPAEILKSLADYEILNVQLFEGQHLGPREIDNLDLLKTIASPIHTDIDYRFSSQPWAHNYWNTLKSAMGFNVVSGLMVSPDTVCDIVRYCQKIVGLKAFW